MLGLQKTNAETEGQMQSSTVFSAGDPSRQAPVPEGNVEPEMAFLDSLNWDDILQPDSNWDSILQDDPNSVQSMLDIWQSEFLFEQELESMTFKHKWPASTYRNQALWVDCNMILLM